MNHSVSFFLQDGSSPSEPLLYLTDPSLQKEEQPYIKCHIDRYSHKNPPVLDGYQGHHLQIKDALTDKGKFHSGLAFNTGSRGKALFLDCFHILLNFKLSFLWA